MKHTYQLGAWLAGTALILCIPAGAADFFVAPGGSDADPGTAGRPFRTIAHARDKVRASARFRKEPITIHLLGGVHYLGQPLVFTAADSGTEAAPVTYRAAKGREVVVSGGRKLELDWRPHRDGILKAKSPPGLVMDQLFVNGERQHMARYPNYDPDKRPYNGASADAFSPERAARWADPAGGFIHAMHRARWGGYHYEITGKTPDNIVAYRGGWQNNRQMGMHKSHRFVENIFEELDAPGEWFHNAGTQTLYYYPSVKTNLETCRVEVATVPHLVEFQGDGKNPVKHITLAGIVFRHATRTFMDNREPLLRSDWTIYRGGAVLFNGAEDCAIIDSEFDQVGGNAIFVNNYNRRIAIRGVHIHGTGASAVCFVGDPASVRSPLFEYEQKQSYDEIDKTPGPKTNNYPADCVVEDCLIHDIGVVEKQATGVQISMSQHITIRHCSIYDLGRAGINISEGTFGGHLIEFCDVFDTVRETGDHGSFNSWGRDRFWHLEGAPTEELPELALLDAGKTIIRNSRWRCDHGWDVDLDDGSSNYEIYNNLFLNGGLKLREGFHRRVYNNIAINNTLHPHVWYDNCHDVVTGNIWMRKYRPAVMDIPKWGREIDRNLFTSEADRAAFLSKGCDANSIVGDPMFVDPANGDFRVREGSPALKIGFKNFPMDRFGVRKPALRAMARTPEIPALGKNTQEQRRNPASIELAQMDASWLGAQLHGLKGDEFSAYGVSKEDGGVALTEVPRDSEADRAGLKRNDLVQGLNGKKIASVDQLLKTYAEAGDAPLEVVVVRDQQKETVKIKDAPFVVAESVSRADDFAGLLLPASPSGTITSNHQGNDDSLGLLVDGKLARGHGPVFANKIVNGAYRMDLGGARAVSAITSWSFDQDGVRGVQRITLFGSKVDEDPGWNLADRSQFVPLGTIDTTRLKNGTFNGVSLRARKGQSLGTFRWIVWRALPVTARAENTAFQELHVELLTED